MTENKEPHKVSIYVDGKWSEAREFASIRTGDIFRDLEEDGKPGVDKNVSEGGVFYTEVSAYQAKTDATSRVPKGLTGFTVECVPFHYVVGATLVENFLKELTELSRRYGLIFPNASLNPDTEHMQEAAEISWNPSTKSYEQEHHA